eukprot:TRINITY_DN7177_c0_g1_i11.p1 TRINITY_DN7177_c0_g1~~TRINITY_DN7177_c0_g1_i11.p1  ORF type:complete len:190 (-),score=51.63 TRINITY_DN7177_c0_g1_i11:232-801(-)
MPYLPLKEDKKRDLHSLFGDERRRVAPGLMNDIDREWRMKYLKASQLTKRDMSYHLFDLWDNPAFRKDRLNIFRRIWNAPGDLIEKNITRPALGYEWGFVSRFFLSKSFLGLGFIWFCVYQHTFNGGDWTKLTGFRQMTSKPATMPNNPHYPNRDPRWERSQGSDYYDQGFKSHPASAHLKPSTPTSWD